MHRGFRLAEKQEGEYHVEVLIRKHPSQYRPGDHIICRYLVTGPRGAVQLVVAQRVLEQQRGQLMMGKPEALSLGFHSGEGFAWQGVGGGKMADCPFIQSGCYFEEFGSVQAGMLLNDALEQVVSEQADFKDTVVNQLVKRYEIYFTDERALVKEGELESWGNWLADVPIDI